MARLAVAALADAHDSTCRLYLANTLIHTRDLARATGLDYEPPSPDTLAIALGRMRQFPADERAQGKAYAEVPDLPTSTQLEELLAWSGRLPVWAPSLRP